MSKRSAKDELLARIDADIQRVAGHANYIGGDGTPELKARIDADLEKFQAMRDYVAAAVPVSTLAVDKPKRTRGPNRAKRGLPEAGARVGLHATDDAATGF